MQNLLYRLFYPKRGNNLLNKHHALQKKTWSYKLGSQTHQETVYWGDESTEKKDHFLISCQTSFAAGGVAPCWLIQRMQV